MQTNDRHIFCPFPLRLRQRPSHAVAGQDDERYPDRTKSITLYTFDRDVADSGKSICNGECARNWLHFYAPPGAMANADYQIITRDDGKSQWAIKGQPLYHGPEDQEPGDKYGDGYNNLWRLIGATGPVTMIPSAASEGY